MILYHIRSDYIWSTKGWIRVTVLRATPSVYLELQHQVQVMLPQWIDGVDNECDDNVNAIGLMLGDTGLEKWRWKHLETNRNPQSYIIYDSLHRAYCLPHLVFMAGSLAVLGDGFQGLANQIHVILIYIKAQQPETSCGASTDTVQELKSLTHQIVVGLVVLVPQKVLDSKAETKVNQKSRQQ